MNEALINLINSKPKAEPKLKIKVDIISCSLFTNLIGYGESGH